MPFEVVKRSLLNYNKRADLFGNPNRSLIYFVLFLHTNFVKQKISLSLLIPPLCALSAAFQKFIFETKFNNLFV